MMLLLIQEYHAPRGGATSDAGAVLIQRRQLQRRELSSGVQLVVLNVRRRQLLHRQQVRDLAGRTTHRETRSPPLSLKAAAAAATHRRLIVKRQRVTVIADLAG